MKKTLFFIFAILLFSQAGVAQVFSTAQTLSPKQMNLGILPTIADASGTNDFILFVQGGYGLRKGIDLGVKLGVLADETYFGADVEFMAMKNLSIAGGFHSFGDFGLDLSGIYTFPLTTGARLTSGLDLDMVFAENETLLPLWIPLNLEVDIRNDLVFIFEADIDTKLFDESYNLISGGVQFYF